MTVYKITILVALGLFCLHCRLLAQAPSDGHNPLVTDSVDSLLRALLTQNFGTLNTVFSSPIKLKTDSLFNLGNPSKDLNVRRKVDQRKTPVIKLNGGYVSYQWIQRTGVDTPFIETNSSQHLIQGSVSAVLADAVPVRVSYIERRSNSQIFQDFRDIRVEFDVRSFYNMQRAKAQKKLSSFEDKLQKPSLKPTIDQTNRQLNVIKSTLNQTAVRKKFLDCKEMVLSPEVLDTLERNRKDSSLRKAKEFVTLYEKVEAKKDSLQHAYDSLRTEFIQIERNIKTLRLLANGQINSANVASTKDSLVKAGLSERDVKQIIDPASPVRSFAIGRTLPNFSNLTLKNTNVKGLHFEYNKNNFYAAGAAGKIDLRSRDFFYRGSFKPNQYVYSFRFGYGKKEGSNLIATYYEGRKQISLSSMRETSLVRGSSIAGQLLLFRNTRANIEFAQSFAPYIYDSSYRSNYKTIDKNSQALSVGIRSYVLKTKTKLEANYIKQGANFQSFTGYRINGASSIWYVKAEQDFFKKVIHIIGSVRKNDLANPFVIQKYDANTVIKNFSASFRKRNLPTVTISMMPSSQYTLVDNQVYENRYQSFGGSIFHVYNIGAARSSSSLVFTRLYNSSSDSGFVYFNAKNLLFSQSLDFSSFIVNSGFSYTTNGVFTMTVLQTSLSHKLFGESAINYGLKINRLNDNADLKFGFFSNTKINLSRIGEVNINLEKSYLPNGINKLSKYEFFTIGFTRYFN